MFRRSIYFVRDMAEGQAVTRDDIKRIRPGFGLQPRYYDTLVGKRLKVAVTRGTPTRLDQFID